MQTRRSFFSRLGALVAVVAMAPEIAFAAKLDVQPTLNLPELFENIYAIARSRRHQPEIEIWTDKAGLDALFAITGDDTFQSPFPEPVNLSSCGHTTIGIYEQLRACRV